MIGLVVVVAALAVALDIPRRVMVGGLVLSVFLMNPLLGLAALGGIGLHLRLASIRASRSATGHAGEDGLAALELVGLGVTAGLPFRNAATLTAVQLEGPTGSQIDAALRHIAAGHPTSIEDGDIKDMFSVAAASEHSGMPLGAALNALARDSRRDAASAAKERLSKLPVKMLFPLAFLILPGFVMLAVVPPLVSGLSRLGL